MPCTLVLDSQDPPSINASEVNQYGFELGVPAKPLAKRSLPTEAEADEIVAMPGAKFDARLNDTQVSAGFFSHR